MTIFTDAPCDSTAGYSFIACLRNSVSRMVGCRLPWDQWSNPAIPECWETRQLVEHDTWHFLLAEIYERERVIKETGCQVPCSYVKYELANKVKYKLDDNYLEIICFIEKRRHMVQTETLQK